MGLEASSLKDLEQNEYLEKFCSDQVLTPFDPIWNKLFSHSIKPILVKDEDFLLDTAIDRLKTNLIQNNPKTKNVTALIEVFATRSRELSTSVQTSDNIFIWQAYNSLFMIRNILKYFYSTLSEDQLYLQFERKVEENVEGVNGVGAFVGEPTELILDCLIQIILELELNNVTYIIHLEAINTMIVILSQQMFLTNKPASRLRQFRFLMEGGNAEASSQFTKILLNHFIEQREPPYPTWNNTNSGSIVLGVASGIWNILKKGVGISSANCEIMENLKKHKLADQSLYLLLILVNHCTGGNNESYVNPFRAALVTSTNLVPLDESAQDSNHVNSEGIFKVSYLKLFGTICNTISTDETTLLLYLLVFENSEFMSYIMARSDIENLILPIIQTLYNAPMSSTHHIYMSLIVLLVLSEEELFNQQIHDIYVENVSWYTERTLTEISLGGLIILVIIRTIQYNILKMRDKYLHTNCLAALANMSSKFRSLHPYVAQRLVSLFETLGKKYLKLLDRANTIPPTDQHKEPELAQDIAVLEEVLRMTLEILNSALSHQLPHNRHLVYTLLYKKDILIPFSSHEPTMDLISNLDTVINYFIRRLGEDYHVHTVSQVMDKINEGILHWKPDILKKFPELKFRYVEEESPEAFFVPYIWSLIFQKSGIHWSNVNMDLFSLEPEAYA